MALRLGSTGSARVNFGDPPIGGASAISVALTVKPAGAINEYRLLNQFLSGGNYGILIRILDVDEVGFLVSGNGYTSQSYGLKTQTLNIATDQVYRMLWRWSAPSTMSLWINGVDWTADLTTWIINGTVPDIHDSPADLELGYDVSAGTGQDGDYAEFAMWTESVPDKIAAAYTRGQTIGHYRTANSVIYAPLVNTSHLVDRWKGSSPANVGGSNARHPRIYFTTAAQAFPPPIPSGLTPISETLTAPWDTRAALTEALSAQFDLWANLSESETLLWDNRAAIAEAFTALWDAEQTLSETLNAPFDTRVAIAEALAVRYDLLTALAETTTLSWDARAALIEAITARWDVVAKINETLSAPYDIAGTSESLPPNTLLDQTNLSGALADIDEDPAGPDGAWLTAASDNVDSICRTGFPTPAADLQTGANLQTFRAWVRVTANASAIDFNMYLYEAGSILNGGAPIATLNTASTSGVLITGTWNAALLADISGADVEVEIVATKSGGSPAARTTGEVGAIAWDVALTNGLTPISETLSVPFDTRAAISELLDARWDDFAAIAESVALSWDTREQLAENIAAAWDTRAALVETTAIPYDVFAGVLETLSAQWDSRAALAETTTAPWDVAATVSEVLTALWDGAGVISETLTAPYDIAPAPGQISETLGVSFDIREGISETTAVPFDTLAALTEAVQLLFDTRQVISETETLPWDVAGVLTETFTARWDARQALAEMLASSADIREEITEVLTARADIRANIGETVDIRWDSGGVLGETLTLKFSIDGLPTGIVIRSPIIAPAGPGTLMAPGGPGILVPGPDNTTFAMA
ncbi:MAG: hypothetical protein ACPGO3_00475 [Magnetospiraceae bacterium]